jgi:hypothetical protein
MSKFAKRLKTAKLYFKVYWREFCAGQPAWYALTFLMLTLVSIFRACYAALRYGASPWHHFIFLLFTAYLYASGKRKEP